MNNFAEQINNQDIEIDWLQTSAPIFRQKSISSGKSIIDYLYFQNEDICMTDENQKRQWHEDVLIYEAANGNAQTFDYLIENKTLSEVWRLLTLNRAFNKFQ